MNTSTPARRRFESIAIAVAALLVSAGVCLAAGSLGVPVAGAVAAYVILIFLFRSALRHWRTDWDERGPDLRLPGHREGNDRVDPDETVPLRFDAERTIRMSQRRLPRGCVIAAVTTIALVAAAAPASAQQTLFNVPSAYVLDKGKLYLEEDTLWRPSDPDFAVFTMRGVYGLGAHVEGGINVGGFVTPGRSTPSATLALKWQPVKVDNFALTTGAQGLFFLRGSKDGDPAGQFYAHASYAFPTNTRLTAGGWVATSGYAGADSTRGGLFGLEQKVNDHLTVAADWFSGRNGLGYFSPGIISAWGPWTIYAAWSLKNGDSKGNAALIELGFLF
jgi:hypothetical protein